ncbi:MAG: zinc-ribbon and DUF3426 domain-containing protein [Woeseiaceae bacterium]|nr:zinc-ribbon and DUF3426 domain-containing protein [Woeseiaceae bacterium]
MYTQCPECGLAFRVTAEVLKQAAGKVRCGGCGYAFNALAHLSESRPESKPQPTAEVPVAATPDPVVAGQPDTPPAAISREQSAALLETLDQLAGDDVRLEDTGVEWRVIDEADARADADNSEDAPDASGLFVEEARLIDDELSATTTHVDEMLDDTPGEVDELLSPDESPTPVDQFLTRTPNQVEAGELFQTHQMTVDAAEVFENTQTPVTEELRFDDNTGLPDDFDFDAVEAAAPPEPEPEPEPVPESTPEPQEQVDLALGDPDEWGELLGEVEEPAPVAAAPEPEPQPEPEQAPEQATGMSLEEELAALPEVAEDVAEPSIADELTALDQAALDQAALDQKTDASTEIVIEAGDDDLEPKLDEVDKLLQQFPESTGELEFELSRAQEALADVENTLDGVLEEPSEEELELSADGDLEAFEDAEEVDLSLQGVEGSEDEELELSLDDARMDVEPSPEEEVAEAELELSLSVDDVPEPEPLEPGQSLEEPLEIVTDEPTGEHVVPEPTSDEMTINQAIDEDLMRLAIEDEDGFASTMVVEGKKPAANEPKPKKRKKDKKKKRKKARQEALELEDESAAADQAFEIPEDAKVETIIMEGGDIADAFADIEAADAIETRSLEDLHAEHADDPAIAEFIANPRKEKKPRKPAGPKVIAAVVVLALVLVVQVIHQMRATLATVPAINAAIGPIYRALGVPISPDWDPTGWRFEATEGRTNPTNLTAELSDTVTDDAAPDPDGPEVLTIVSRIGNESEQALPYPKIHVSLTDRYEEVIGENVLDPADYLPGQNPDPRVLVEPGTTFEAMISIESPSPEATGYKLNVCYAAASGQLRCAAESFK